MIRIDTLQAGSQCYPLILGIPFGIQINADSVLHGKDEQNLRESDQEKR